MRTSWNLLQQCWSQYRYRRCDFVEEQLSDVFLSGRRSFLEVASVDVQRSPFCFQFELRPSSADGLVLFIGHPFPDAPFLALSLRKSILFATLSAGKTSERLLPKASLKSFSTSCVLPFIGKKSGPLAKRGTGNLITLNVTLPIVAILRAAYFLAAEALQQRSGAVSGEGWQTTPDLN